MRLKALRSTMNLSGKRVLVRIDANVPIKGGRTVDGEHGKVARAAVDLEWLRQRGAKIIVMTHLGRPKGKRIAAYSTAPVARRLSGLMSGSVKHCRYVIGKQVAAQVEKMKDGDVVVLENLRYDIGEPNNDPAFAKEMAKFGDIYINNAFAVCHRKHASVSAITKELPAYAGPSLVHEVSVLSSVFDKPRHPFVLLMGGLKAHDKVAVMKKLYSKVDTILVGGALATTFLVAEGYKVGKSVFDQDGVKIAKALLGKDQKKFVLPEDVRVAKSLRSRRRSKVVPIDKIGSKDYIVDLGPKTIRQYRKLIKRSKMIVWNGPVGLCEIEAFCVATESFARGIAMRTGKATTVVGGGDTLPVVDEMHLAKRYTLLSSGGGAMLEFLAGKKLPGLEALRQK